MSFSANIVRSNSTPAGGGGRGDRGGGRGGKFIPHKISPPSYHRGGHASRGRGRGRGLGYRCGGSFNYNTEAPILHIPTTVSGMRTPITFTICDPDPHSIDPVASNITCHYFNPQAKPFVSNIISQQNRLSSHSGPLSTPQAPRCLGCHFSRNQQSRKAFHNSKRNGNMRHLGAQIYHGGSHFAQGGIELSHLANYTANCYAGHAKFLLNPEWDYSTGSRTNQGNFAGNGAREDRTIEGAQGFKNVSPKVIPFDFDFNERSLTTAPAGNVVISCWDSGPDSWVSWNLPSFPRPTPKSNGRLPQPRVGFNVNAPSFIPAAFPISDQCGHYLKPPALIQAYRTPMSITPSIKDGGTNDPETAP